MTATQRVCLGRRYSRYLALQTVRGAADSANKHDVTNGSVTSQLHAIDAISSEVVYYSVGVYRYVNERSISSV